MTARKKDRDSEKESKRDGEKERERREGVRRGRET